MSQPSTSFTGAMPDVYDTLLVPVLFAPYARVLAERVAALAPRRVLEVAAGSGVLTRELLTRLPDAEITATDLSPGMVQRGAACCPAGVRWQQADMQALPFPDAAVDVWACQFGVMFAPDRTLAYREAARVLAPGGHLVLSTWTGLSDNGFAAVLDTVLATRSGSGRPTFVRAVPHGYADPELVRAELTAAGLADVGVDEVRLTSRAASAQDVARAFLTGTPAGAEVLAGGGEAALPGAVDEVAAALRERYGSGPVEAPMSALVATARRPAA